MSSPDQEQDARALVAWQIRPMRREDVDAMCAIEQASYPAPWSREVFLEEEHRAWAHIDVLCEAEGGPVLGYVNYWLVGDEVHVLNVTVHPEARRRGLGARLVAHLAEFASNARCTFVTLEVRRANRAALALYRRHGFRPVGLRPRYYHDGEDAIVMLRDL